MRYSHVLQTVRRSNDGWTAEAPEDWLQGRTVFGGLQAALAVRAMRDLVSADLPLRVLQTSFIAPVPPGTLHITASVIRSGKSVTHVEARIMHEDRTACLVIGIFGTSRPSQVRVALAPPQVAPVSSATPVVYVDGLMPRFTGQVDMSWVGGVNIFKGIAEPKTQTYVGFRDEPFAGRGLLGEAQVIGYADIIPTPALSMVNAPAMASSLTWTLELLTDDLGPARDGLWLMDSVVEAAGDGYVNQSTTLWSPEGQAMALSRQSVTVFA